MRDNGSKEGEGRRGKEGGWKGRMEEKKEEKGVERKIGEREV